MGPLIAARELASRLGEPGLVVADVRWNPAPPPSGRGLFERAHIPGAVYIDLDDDLSDRSDLSRGRHPLPDPGVFVRTLASVGIGKASDVVCADDQGGAFAGRLYWMLKHWLGHGSVRVLDGGLDAWRAEGLEIEMGAMRERSAASDPLGAETNHTAYLDMTQTGAHVTGGGVLLDARPPERFRGETEPLDPVAGHIPGATNRPVGKNLVCPPGGDGVPMFREAEDLRAELETLGTGVVTSCGSGVTGCHHVLAFEVAGLEPPRLYVGSWSEWCRNQESPERN